MTKEVRIPIDEAREPSYFVIRHWVSTVIAGISLTAITSPARIQAAAEKRPERHVATEPQPYRLVEQLLEPVDVFFFARSGSVRCEADIPVLLHADLASLVLMRRVTSLPDVMAGQVFDRFSNIIRKRSFQ